MKLLDNYLPPAINLTTNQKMLLAKIVAAPDAGMPGKKVPLNNEKLVVAKGVLVKLGLITVDDETGLFRILPKAIDLMREDGLVDETGALTDAGDELAAGNTANSDTFTQRQNQSPMNQGAQPIPSVTGMEQQPRVGESVHISFKQFLQKTT